MQKLKNKEKELKLHLSILKKSFGENPFTSENYVKPEFMFFTVDYYLNILKDINDHVDYRPDHNPNEIELEPPS